MNERTKTKELSILESESQHYKSEGRIIFASIILAHLAVGYIFTGMAAYVHNHIVVVIYDALAFIILSILPLTQRYEDMHALDGISHISLLVNALSFMSLGLLGGIAISIQYFRKVYIPGRCKPIYLENIIRTLSFVALGIFLQWIIFAYDLEASDQKFNNSSILITWKLLPVMSISGVFFLTALIPMTIAIILKVKLGIVYLRSKGGHIECDR